jgi:hypothetical protein
MDKIIDRVIHICVYLHRGDKTAEYYKGLIFFGRWILHLYQIPKSDVPKGLTENERRKTVVRDDR